MYKDLQWECSREDIAILGGLHLRRVGPNAFSPHLAWVDLGPEHLLISLLPPRPSTQSFFSSFDILYIAKLAEGSQNGRYREDDLSS